MVPNLHCLEHRLYSGNKLVLTVKLGKIGNKSATFNVITSSKITRIYGIEEIHTFHPFVLIQHV